MPNIKKNSKMKPLILRKKNKTRSELNGSNKTTASNSKTARQSKQRLRKERLTLRLKAANEAGDKKSAVKTEDKTVQTDVSSTTGNAISSSAELQQRLSEMEKIGLKFGFCKICLDVGRHKKLWDKYYLSDNLSDADDCLSYGETIMECYSVNIQLNEYNKEDLLCIPCIRKLNAAESFRKQLLESKVFLVEIPQEELFDSKEYSNNEHIDVNIAVEELEELFDPKDDNTEDDEEILVKIEPEALTNVKVEYVKSEDMTCDMDTEDDEFKISGDAAAHEFVELEYLDDDGDEELNEAVYAGYSKSRRRGKGSRTSYKTYTKEKLHRCLNAVLKEGMSKNAAAKMFNIPRRSIGFHIDKGTQFTDPTECTLGDEIKTMLRFTNATPFKTRHANKLACVICNVTIVSGSHFEQHMRQHGQLQGEQKLARIHARLYTHWEKHTVKLDIRDLRCTECSDTIENWNDVFAHLADTHNVHLVQARTHVIPYILKDDVHDCVLCDEVFTSFRELDLHMSVHYPNYVCSDCGESFFSSDRFMKHSKIHQSTTYPCGYCKKIFFVDLYRKKHEESAHLASTSYKCKYCDKQLSGYSERREHVQLEHPLEVKYIGCELCGETFTWKTAFYSHLKEVHMDEMKHACKLCPKVFFTERQLKRHNISHRINKQFKCEKCNKKFVTEWSLVLHTRTHSKRKARTMDMNLAEQTAKKITVSVDADAEAEDDDDVEE